MHQLPGQPTVPSRLRRWLLLSGVGAALRQAAPAQPPGVDQAAAAAPSAIVFPRDFGSHPDLRTEWWYITGHTRVGSGAQTRVFGFQLTFFRARVDNTQRMASRFAARQLLFAHAAVTDVQGQRFWHQQRIARQGFEVASASELDTGIRLRDWSLVRQAGVYLARVSAPDFELKLSFSQTQGVLLQGDNGLSRKGPDAGQSSYYYSQPQLAFEGEIRIQGQRIQVSGDGAQNANASFTPGRGAAWLDHEWSDGLLHPAAAGWDWIGINLYDGSALMAFQMRDTAGKVLWDGGALRQPGMKTGTRPYVFKRGEVVFQPLRGWNSRLTRTTYPVEWMLSTPADHYIVRALLDNQELDSRNSTGAVYWEGLSDLFDNTQRHLGRGYLEMTGYTQPLVL